MLHFLSDSFNLVARTHTTINRTELTLDDHVKRIQKNKGENIASIPLGPASSVLYVNGMYNFRLLRNI